MKSFLSLALLATGVLSCTANATTWPSQTSARRSLIDVASTGLYPVQPEASVPSSLPNALHGASFEILLAHVERIQKTQAESLHEIIQLKGMIQTLTDKLTARTLNDYTPLHHIIRPSSTGRDRLALIVASIFQALYRSFVFFVACRSPGTLFTKARRLRLLSSAKRVIGYWDTPSSTLPLQIDLASHAQTVLTTCCLKTSGWPLRTIVYVSDEIIMYFGYYSFGTYSVSLSAARVLVINQSITNVIFTSDVDDTTDDETESTTSEWPSEESDGEIIGGLTVVTELVHDSNGITSFNDDSFSPAATSTPRKISGSFAFYSSMEASETHSADESVEHDEGTNEASSPAPRAIQGLGIAGVPENVGGMINYQRIHTKIDRVINVSAAWTAEDIYNNIMKGDQQPHRQRERFFTPGSQCDSPISCSNPIQRPAAPAPFLGIGIGHCKSSWEVQARRMQYDRSTVDIPDSDTDEDSMVFVRKSCLMARTRRAIRQARIRKQETIDRYASAFETLPSPVLHST